MISVYLCEDNAAQLGYWKKLIENIIFICEWDMEIKAAVTTPGELLENINRDKPETAIYFLDVDLKSFINGIQLAVEIRKYDPRAFIVFVTSHDEMAIYTFKYRVEPLGYVLKGRPDFNRQIRECLENAYAKYQIPNVPVVRKLSIRMGKKLLILPMDDIYYIEPAFRSRRLMLHKEHEILEFTSSLKEVQKRLDSRFVQCHKAYIVNCCHVTSIDRENLLVHFDNGASCPCSVRQLSVMCRRLDEQKE